MLNKYFGHTNIASTQNVRNGARPHGEGDEEQPLDDDMACRLSELATLYVDMLKLDDAKKPTARPTLLASDVRLCQAGSQHSGSQAAF